MNQEIIRDIVSRVDHTLLAQTAAWKEIRALCDDAILFGTASVCIPPCFVRRAKEYVGDRMADCTVAGFPNGYPTKAAKVFEAKEAAADGADEVDMVINLGLVKEGRFDLVLDEIQQIRKAVEGKILKVIVETCLLSQEEKIKLCGVVTESGADYIKTSTGFSAAGALVSDIKLFAGHVGEGVKIKAAGGITSFEDAAEFVAAGADRLGTSRIVKLLKEKL